MCVGAAAHEAPEVPKKSTAQGTVVSDYTAAEELAAEASICAAAFGAAECTKNVLGLAERLHQ